MPHLPSSVTRTPPPPSNRLAFCRMRYAALTVSAFLSALWLAAVCVLWVRSYSMTDDVYWYGGYRDGQRVAYDEAEVTL